MPTYTQPNLPKSVRLSDDAYNQALLKFPKWCHDVIFRYAGRLWLPTRRPDKTPSGLWFVGGQVALYTDLRESLVQTIWRETKLTFDPGRFQHVGQNRYWFDGSDGGVPHDAVSEVFCVEVTVQELSWVVLDQNEYAHERLTEIGFRDLHKIPNLMTQKIFADLWQALQMPSA